MILNYKSYGEGDEVLIIVHGLFGSLDNWSTLGRRFSDKRRVILVDQRNHGHSFHHDDMDYEVMAEDLVRLMDELDIEKAMFIGHSMGGKTIMKLSTIAPERIIRMIVADIGPQEYEPHHDQVFQAIHAVDTSELSSRTAAEEMMGRVKVERGVQLFLLKNLYWKEKGKLDWRMNLSIIESHMEDILDTIGHSTVMTPTLFVRGGKSDYIQEADIMGIQFQFPMSEIVTIEGVGHWLHAEAPGEFYEIADDFLS